MEHECPTGTKGFGYLKRCLELACADPSLVSNINKGLYDSIAIEDNTSSQNIDRNIRTVIDMWWPALSRQCIFQSKPKNKELVIKLTTILGSIIDTQTPKKPTRPTERHVCIFERIYG